MIIYIVLITLSQYRESDRYLPKMTFIDLLQSTFPTRRGVLCRLYRLRRRLGNMRKEHGVTCWRVLQLLREALSFNWTNTQGMVFEVRTLVEDVHNICDIDVQIVLSYLAGYLPHTYFVLRLNKSKLRKGHPGN